MNKQFSHIGKLKAGRSAFDLSHSKLFNCDMGQLIPVLKIMTMPGDIYKLSNAIVVRLQPLITPVLHEINAKVDYFFVPLRLLWPKPIYDGLEETGQKANEGNWETFITRGFEGKDDSTIPVWQSPNIAKYGLWDYMDFPLVNLPPDNLPMSLLKRAYNLIYNEYYRDENLIDFVDLDTDKIQLCAWEKDYFTASLPWQQRGDAQALPISGIGSADFSTALNNLIDPLIIRSGVLPMPATNMGQSSNNILAFATLGTPLTQSGLANFGGNAGTTIATGNTTLPDDTMRSFANMQFATGSPQIGPPYMHGNFSNNTHANYPKLQLNQAFINELNRNIIDFGTAGAITVDDLRTHIQLQKWLERNARGGVRYTEFVYAHFNERTGDARLQRPEYIGGSRSPIVINEVLQTSQSADPVGGQQASALGTMAGHGITADGTHIKNYRCHEHGIMMAIMRILPRTMYSSGINRMWLYKSPFDFPFVEFSHLSEQAITNMELCATTNAGYNEGIFGFIGRYDEHRYIPSSACADMRGNLDVWNLIREFDPAHPPALNKEFIECNANRENLKRIFAVPSEPGCIVHYSNAITALRPLPVIAEPGLVDHF